MEVALKQLGQQLGPTKDSKSLGKQKVDELFRIINTHSNLSYDRLRFVGGAEQKTSCFAYMDFDCVAFVNVEQSWWVVENETEDFEKKLDTLREKVLTDWQRFLPAELGSEVEVRFRGYLCTLEWKELGLKADMLVAPNALTYESSLISSNDNPTGDIQVSNMFEALMKSLSSLQDKDKDKKMKKTSQNFTFSVSVMERSIEMMEKRSATTHEVARLAKFWMLICCPEKRRVQGLSTLISLIATRNSNQNTTVVGGLRQFLCDIISWKELEVDDMLNILQRHVSRYPINVKPKVMDPGNIYNNILMESSGMRGKFLTTFKGKAELSLRRLDSHVGDIKWLQLADILLASRARRYHRAKVPGKNLRVSLSEKKSSSCLFPRIEATKLDESFTKINLQLASIAMSFVPRYDSGRERSYAAFSADFGKILNKVVKCTIVKAVPQVKMEFEMPYVNQSAILVKCYYR